jgi:F-type H+-transporting ATPase subunit c
LAFGTAFGLPIAVIFASTAQGKATSTALEGIARQPEAAPRIQTAMIIGLALIESLVIYSLLIFFLLMGKLPQGAELKEMIMEDAKGSVVQTR